MINIYSDEESGIFSINEMIYSFRKTVDSPLPKIRSQEAIDALNMIKKIKNEIASGKLIHFILFYYYYKEKKMKTIKNNNI